MNQQQGFVIIETKQTLENYFKKKFFIDIFIKKEKKKVKIVI